MSASDDRSSVIAARAKFKHRRLTEGDRAAQRSAERERQRLARVKFCARCGETKPSDDFHRAEGRKFDLNAYCKPCRLGYVSEGKKRRRRKNPDRPYQVNRRQRTYERHGLTPEQSDAVLHAVREICGEPEREIDPRIG